MLKIWNLSVMLDACDMGYTENQIMKLQKLISTFLESYISKLEAKLYNGNQKIVEAIISKVI